jgi:anaerobic ribonucleoside-triphosphate reductase
MSVKEYLNKRDWRVKENASFSYSLQGLNSYIASEATKKHWLTYFPEEVVQANNDGFIYIHDLGIFGPYCGGHNLEDLLQHGFRGAKDKIHSAPPKRFSTALGQMNNLFFTLSGEFAGAQAFSNFDTLLAPYVWKDDLSYEDVEQAMQEFIFALNIPTRIGFQQPFSNLTFDITVPEKYKNKKIIIAGEDYCATYGMMQHYMDMINKAFCEVMVKGDARGAIFTFPIPTYNITKEFEWDKVPAEIWQMTAKFGTPYFANYVNSEMSASDSLSMCCLTHDTALWAKVKGRTTLTTLGKLYDVKTEDIKVLQHGEWKECKTIKVPYEKEFYEITLKNGAKIRATDNHEHFTQDGIKSTLDLKVGDLIPCEFGIKAPTPSQEDGSGGYNLGYLIGLFLAEGSYCGTDIQFTIGKSSEHLIPKIQNIVSECFACKVDAYDLGTYYNVGVHGKIVAEFMKQYVTGKHTDKKLISVYGMNRTFLLGIWQGWFAGDGKVGGDEAYTCSKSICDTMSAIASILGFPHNIRITDRKTTLGGKDYDSRLYTIHLCKIGAGAKIYKYKQENLEYSEELKNLTYSGFVVPRQTTYLDTQTEIVEIKRCRNSGGYAYCVQMLEGDKSFTLASGVVTHNCRLKLNLADIRKRGNGLFSAHPNTGSIGVVTLNLPRIVHYHGLNFDAIKKYAELAKECLEIKRQVIEEQTENGLYPYAQHLLRHAKDCSNTYWGNHFSTIGIIGMHEALLEAGKQGGIVNHMSTAEAVLEYIQKLTIDFQKTTGHLYNLEATPAEGCTYTLAKKDKKCGIITSGNKEPYYTNSVHFPVGHEIDMFDMIKQQENIQSMFTGGTVLHLFLGEAIQDPMVVKKLVQRITSESKIPYFSITPTFSVCPEHGYISGEHFNCPDCDAEADVYTRIVGYFRPVKNWNKGKEEEYFERKVYKLGGAK